MFLTHQHAHTQETCEPRVLQEVKVELAPHQTSTPPPFQNCSFSSVTPHLIPTTLIQNVGPSMNIIHSPSPAIVESTSRSPDGQEDNLGHDLEGDRFELLSTTPSVPRQGASRLPMRRVHPIQQTGDGAPTSANDDIEHRQLLGSSGQLTRSSSNRNRHSDGGNSSTVVTNALTDANTNGSEARSQRHTLQQANQTTTDPSHDCQPTVQEVEEQDIGEAPLPPDVSNKGNPPPRASKEARSSTQGKPDPVGFGRKGRSALPRRLSLRRSPRKQGEVTKTFSTPSETETRRSLFDGDKQQPSKRALTESHDDITPAAEHVVTVSKATRNIEADNVRLDTTRSRKRVREDSPNERSVASKKKKTNYSSSSQLEGQVSSVSTTKTSKNTPTRSESETVAMKTQSRGQRSGDGKRKELTNRTQSSGNELPAVSH